MKKKQFAKLLHLGIGVHSFGNATTIIAKPNHTILELTPLGVLATSLTHRKKALIPYANIKTVELEYDSDYNNEVEQDIPLNEVQAKVAEINKARKVV